MIGSLTVSGCSLIDSYLKWNLPAIKDFPPNIQFSLPYAIKYANNARDAYQTKLSDNAKLTNTLAPGLITLGAIVLGLAAYGAHTDTILGVALGGGTAYSLGNWFSNNTRELVYIAGMKGMSCAVDAVLPLNFSKRSREMLEIDAKALSGSIANVNSAIGNVRNRIPAAEPHDTALADSARTLISRVETHIKTADETYASGSILLRHVDTVGTDLVAAVDRIGVAVDRAVQQTQPRLESVVNVISQLSDASNIFAPGLDLRGTLAGRITPEPSPQSLVELTPAQLGAIKMLRIAVNDLASMGADLASRTRQVASVVNSVNKNRPIETLKDCGVNVSEISTDITVAPTQVQFKAKTAGKRTIIVSGGKSPYVARLLESSTPGVSVQNPIPGDRSIVVKATKDVTVGTYTLFVADAANHDKTVSINVRGVKQDNRNGDDLSTFDKALGDLAKALSDGQFEFEVDGAQDAIFKIEEATPAPDGTKVQVVASVNPPNTPWPDTPRSRPESEE